MDRVGVLIAQRFQDSLAEGVELGFLFMPDDEFVSAWTASTWSSFKSMATALGITWCFRGHQEETWELKNSLERSDSLDAAKDEYALVHYFRRRAPVHLPGHLVPPQSDVLGWLAVMQHYGAPTRLVDFTSSPYAAAFFALERKNPRGVDHAVWAIDSRALTRGAIEAYRVYKGINEGDAMGMILGSQGDVVANLVFTQVLDDHSKFAGVIRVEPPLYDARQAAQQALFLCPGDISRSFMENLRALGLARESVKKLIIPTNLRAEALEDLRAMNVTAASLFPGLDGMARSLHMNLTLESDEQRALRTAVELTLLELGSMSDAERRRLLAGNVSASARASKAETPRPVASARETTPADLGETRRPEGGGEGAKVRSLPTEG